MTLQDWKENRLSLLGNVDKFQAELPEQDAMDKLAQVNLSDLHVPHLLIAKMIQDPTTTRWKCVLDGSVRSKWAKHPVFGADWMETLEQFDRVFGPVVEEQATNEAPSGAGDENADWSAEPANHEKLVAQYEVVSSFPARNPQLSFIVTKSSPKEPAEIGMDCVDGQAEKLWLVAAADVEVSAKEYLIAHGASTFLKVKRGKEVSKEGPSGCLFFTCTFFRKKHLLLFNTLTRCRTHHLALPVGA